MKKNIKNRLTHIDIRRAKYGLAAREVLQAIKDSERGLPPKMAKEHHNELFDTLANYFDYNSYSRISLEDKIKIFLEL